jgi:tetratricopeptide (TPR) repeat protein
MPGRLEPLEWLVDTYGRTSDSFRLPDALAQLGDALVAEGQYSRAKEVFEQLVEREPESDSPKRKLNEVLRKLGQAAPEPEALPADLLQTNLSKDEAETPRLQEAVAGMEVDEDRFAPPPKAATAEPALDEETQKFIAQSLTDVDLFASYGLTQKAIGLLEAILRRAPRHTPTLEKLLDFVLGAGNDRRTAELAAQLENIHREEGDEHSAERFGELRRRFQRAAGLTDAEVAAGAAANTVPPEAKQEAKEEAASEADAQKAAGQALERVHEVDLSEEWSSLMAVAPQETPAAPQVPASAAASTASNSGRAQASPEPAPAEFEVPLEAAPASEAPHAHAETFPAVADEAHEAPTAPEARTEPTPMPTAQAAEKKPAPGAAEPQEFEQDQDFDLVLQAEPLVPAHEQKPPEPAPEPASASAFACDQFLAELANEIGDLGLGELTPSYSQPAPPTEPARPAATAESASPAESAPLKEVFEEFRAELGEMGVEEEDLETHYNLGIAFREMGLLEEAISEFQKVAKASDQGRPFRYAMQCCTLLGLSFMEKGQPAIAAIWYERALQAPGVDGEGTLALRYDLGVAQETAGDSGAALKSFAQVYAMNIDYRDVAERIATLQKTAR